MAKERPVEKKARKAAKAERKAEKKARKAEKKARKKARKAAEKADRKERKAAAKAVRKLEERERKRARKAGEKKLLAKTDAVPIVHVAPAPTWLVEVGPRPGAPDAEGQRIAAEARAVGLPVRAARSATLYELGGTDRSGALAVAERLLADAILEVARVTSKDEPPAGNASLRPGESVATCLRKPGVMDPVALSTLAAARDVGVHLASVRVARRAYVLAEEGRPLDAEALERLATRVLGNDVLDRALIGATPLPDASRLAGGVPPSLAVPLRDLDDERLLALSRRRTLALDVHEMRAVQAHYRAIGREPTELELETIAQTWSEHCKHKTLTGPIDLVEVDEAGRERAERIGNLLKETIFGATKELDLPRCKSVFEDNAGVIDLDGKTGIAVKVETHNHPSAIEPYGGSETGVGGVIRDILGTGLGARPIASLDVFCVGDLHAEEVPRGAIRPRALLAGVVAGVRDYGNRMGIPTVAGGLVSEPRYVGNPLVYCGTVGTIPLDKVAKAARPGDRIVVAGGRTGRDGIHGATFSSDALTSESETVSSGAVQIGNAIEEKKLADVLLALRDAGALHAVTDCGAGGLSSAVGEMARETGASVELARVPLKYEGLAPWEIWVSEAQERMVLAVPPGRVEEVLAAFAAEDVEARDLGSFTGDGRLVVKMHDQVVGDLDQHFLHEGLPRTPLPARWEARRPAPLEAPRVPPADALRRLLGHPSVCSREWIVRQYDHEVQGQSVLKALSGARSDGPSDAVAVAVAPGERRGVLIGLGLHPRLSDHDPALMAWWSIDEAIRNVVAAGGDPDACALLDNFSWGDCRRDPRELAGIVRAARACREAALAYRAPFISGKDSLNNVYVTAEGRRISIPGTLLVTCVATFDDPARLVTMDLKSAGERLYLVGETRDERGGSHWLELVGGRGGTPPRAPREAPAIYRKLHGALRAGLASACHDLSEGGFAVALAEMAFAGEVGASVSLASVLRAPGCDDEALLFSESAGRLLVSVPRANAARFEAALGGAAAAIGETTAEPRLRVTGQEGERLLDEDLLELKRAWQATLPGLYETAAVA